MAAHHRHAKLVKPLRQDTIPALYGLVLAGGESRRMGSDKSKLEYHGVAQLEHIFTLLQELLSEVYISKRDKDEWNHRVIADTFIDLGPYGGVLSAFRFNPNVAWLTVPCDMPLLDKPLIEQLISGREHERLATCFFDPATGLPEPLLTIWEPRAYPFLLQKLGEGISCLRKSLVHGDVKIVDIDDALKLRNANTPEEAEGFRDMLRRS